MSGPIGLYIHIPFCERKCAYCDFASFAGKEHLTERYLAHLCREITEWGKALGRLELASINFGGGTPSVLTASQISKVLKEVRASLVWPDDIEVSLEANPGSGELEKFRGYLAAGVNRLSFGAQSFDDDELKRLGRIHTAADIVEAYGAARRAGFQNINLDFMFALPDQTLEKWQRNLRTGVALGPDHISTYNLQIEEGTPYFTAHQRGQLNLPDEDTELEMYQWAIAHIKESGYHHYEISNFAKRGRECRHNLIYWRNKNWLGVGSGAHSHLDGRRFANPDAIEAYFKEDNIAQRRMAALSFPVPLRDQIVETMMMGLRLNDGIDLNNFLRRFGAPLENFYPAEVDELFRYGLIERRAGALRLTSTGLPLANLVFEHFLEPAMQTGVVVKMIEYPHALA